MTLHELKEKYERKWYVLNGTNEKIYVTSVNEHKTDKGNYYMIRLGGVIKIDGKDVQEINQIDFDKIFTLHQDIDYPQP